jgi:cell division transport system ATP-binding protein
MNTQTKVESDSNQNQNPSLHNHLSFQNVEITAHGLPLLHDINLETSRGQCSLLFGPNGAGKSTLLKSIYGDSQITKGKAVVCDYNLINIKSNNVYKLRRRLGIMSRDYEILMDMTPGELLLILLNKFSKLDKANRIARVKKLINLVDQHNNLDVKLHRLNKGDRQIINLVRAAINLPEILLLDEPTTDLDKEYALRFFNCLELIRSEYNISAIIATKSEQIASRIEGILYLINEGTIKKV